MINAAVDAFLRSSTNTRCPNCVGTPLLHSQLKGRCWKLLPDTDTALRDKQEFTNYDSKRRTALKGRSSPARPNASLKTGFVNM
jgi:hypothetical protein